jgi:hypothetical protein
LPSDSAAASFNPLKSIADVITTANDKARITEIDLFVVYLAILQIVLPLHYQSANSQNRE